MRVVLDITDLTSITGHVEPDVVALGLDLADIERALQECDPDGHEYAVNIVRVAPKSNPKGGDS